MDLWIGVEIKVSFGHPFEVIRTEDGDSRFCRNVGTFSRCMMQKPDMRRLLVT
jgi:hypothetical protein